MKDNASKPVLLLASGGLDSTTLAYSLIQQGIEFTALFINYGQHSAHTELTTLTEVLPESYRGKIEVIDISAVYRGSSSRLVVPPDLWHEHVEDEDLFLPQRNLLILSIGAAFAESRSINQLYAGFIETHRAPGADCCDPFFEIMDKLMIQSGKVQIILPLRGLSKAEVARLGVSVGAPIGQTFSCLAAAEIPCGACPNCVDRLQALDSLFTPHEP